MADSLSSASSDAALQSALREVQLLKARFDAILAAAVDGLILINADGIIQTFNAGAERIFGFTAGEIIGQNVNLLMPSPYHEEHDRYLENYRRTGVPKIIGIGREVQGRRKDGSVFPLEIAVGEVLGEPKQYIGIVRDITARKAAEADLREHRERLSHAGRLLTMGEMASGIAHEVTQPLTAIATYAQAVRRMLASGQSDPRSLHDALEHIASQAERAGAIIQRLRGFMRRQDARCEPVDVNEQLRAVVGLAEVDLRDHAIRVELKLTQPLPPVLADDIQLQQVSLNLIRNAVDAMHDTPADRRIITLRTAMCDDAEVEFSVADRGPGIAAENVQHLFAPFFTTKAQGMGLGLSISNSIVATMGGRLWHSNNPQGGAVFHVALPAASTPVNEQ